MSATSVHPNSFFGPLVGPNALSSPEPGDIFQTFFGRETRPPSEGAPKDIFQTFFGEGSPSPSEEAIEDPSQPHLSRLCSQDRAALIQCKHKIIGGYLNLGINDGWKEGESPELGISFARYILLKYFFQKKGHLGANAAVLEKVAAAFKTSASPWGPHLPQESRICLDYSVTQWEKHAIGRLIGNLGSTYDPSKPFFEILVNAAYHPRQHSLSNPFFVSVHANEQELEKRRSLLSSLRSTPEDIARPAFYDFHLQKPEDFLKMHRTKLGPNSTRLLKALTYLQTIPINAQKVGNCWIKQPMRCLLATLYVELISNRPSLTFERAWKEASGLYKDIQKIVAIPFVKELLNQSNVTSKMKESALRGLEKQKHL